MVAADVIGEAAGDGVGAAVVDAVIEYFQIGHTWLVFVLIVLFICFVWLFET